MFLVQEVDKLLASFANNTRAKEVFGVNLPDIDRIDVEELNLSQKVRYPLSSDATLKHNQPPAFSKPYSTTDAVFFDLIKQLVLFNIAQIPLKQYASAKLVLCDTSSYNMLMKLQRMNYQKVKNFIYKPPFSVTAIFLLQDIVDLFDRERKPIVIIKNDKHSGKNVACFNYEFIKQIFPFLRLCDLIIIFKDKGDLILGTFDAKSSRDIQIVQCLAHFASSSMVIELSSLYKSIGYPHIIYDNVLMLPPQLNTDQQYYFDKLPLLHISLMMQTLMRIVKYSNVTLESIAYRAGDPTGQTRLFAQLLATSVSSMQELKSLSNTSYGRVLVMDRFHDVQSVMYHSDTYGSFLEQELQVEPGDEELSKLRIDSIDELDKKLQLERLTDVLSSILRYSMTLTGKSSTTNRSIRRHLNIVKLIYKSLNEGYLLVLKLEANLENICNQVRNIKDPLPPEEQQHLVEALQRVLSAYKQLAATVRKHDLLRLSCIMLDTTNTFLYWHKNNKSVLDIRSYILKNREFSKKLVVYDRLSRDYCGCKSEFSLDKLVQTFYEEQLSQESFPVINLNKKNVTSVIILVFLGYLTPNELAKIKSLKFPTLILACNALKPIEFLG